MGVSVEWGEVGPTPPVGLPWGKVGTTTPVGVTVGLVMKCVSIS